MAVLLCTVHSAVISLIEMIHFFPDKNALFPHNRFSTHFFSMKMAELGENVLVSCIIDFDDIQL